MKERDPHALAAAALRASLSHIVAGLIADVEAGGRANLKIDCLKVKGRAQLETAKRLRKEAKAAGLVR